MASNGMFGVGEQSGNSPSQSSHDQGKRQKLKELVRPIFQESYFTKEYTLLGAVQINQPTKLSGLYAIPSAQTPFMWFAVLFIHNGPWQGGVFRFIMKFPDNFPDGTNQNNLPSIQFTGAYPKCHPLINPSRGNFDIKRYYKTYNRSSNHIWQLMKCTRKIFLKFEITDKVVYPNKTAAELYITAQDQFYKKCEIDVQNSKSKIFEEDIYSNDPNYIRFSKDFRQNESSLASCNVQDSGIGMSWMQSS